MSIVDPNRRQRGAAGVWLLVLATLLLIWWYAGSPRLDWPGGGEKGPPAQPRPVEARGSLAEDERNNIDVFKAVSPSTVNITTLQATRDFFSRDVTQVPSGTGTGIVWDTDGHVVTNFHVIRDADAARVTLADQTTWRAALVGAYPDQDLAVLRIDAPRSKLKPVQLGTSRDLQVGQKVYAIGNPFGLDQTLTTGIVSALDREIQSVTRRPIRGVIQTDAAINPGNSGGPLLDSAGRLIGLNTAIYSPSGASAGIGFAIPVDEINRIVPRLIRDGRIIRPAIGIEAAPPQFSKALGLPAGVAIVGLAPDGPAAKAGLRPFTREPDGTIGAGDVIVAVDGAPITTFDDLQSAIEKHQPGDTIVARVDRAGKQRDVKITLTVGG